MSVPPPRPPRRPIDAKRARAKRTGASTSAKAGGAKRTGKKGRRGKYNAAGEFVDGQWCASKAEADRYRQLLKLQKEGAIDNLECQPAFRITINNQLVCKYVADFRYNVIDERGRTLYTPVEDVKGMVTPMYRLKKKLVQAVHGLAIVEIPGKDVPDWADQPAPRTPEKR